MNGQMNTDFDVSALLGQSHAGGLDARFQPHPVGDYDGMIGVDPEDITIKRLPKGSVILEVNIFTQDPSVIAVTNRDPTKTRFSAFLDMTAAGELDMAAGKNRQLGQLLFALGFQELDGTNATPWAFTTFAGRPLRYSVEHYDSKGTTYDRANRVTRSV